MAEGYQSNPDSKILVENNRAFQFVNGVATITGKTGYVLFAVIVDATTSSEGIYTVTSIGKNESGNYILRCYTNNLTSWMNASYLWCRQ